MNSNRIKNILVGSIKTMRPQQWYKQVIVFLPVVFSGKLLQAKPVISTIISAVAFSLVASSIYTLNDIVDIEEDRKHPKKKHRPIPSGSLPIKIAYVVCLLLCVTGLSLGYIVHRFVLFILILYVLQNFLYSYLLSDIIIVDILVISVGFVLRSISGVYAIRDNFIIPSRWLILCTFLTALLLALGKRYKESKNKSDPRMEYGSWNTGSMMEITSGMLAISYILYTVLDSSIAMMLTIPFSLYAVFRYLLIIENAQRTDSIGGLVAKDKGFVINLVIWVLVIVSVLYVAPVV